MTRQPGTYAMFNTSEGTIVCRLFEKDAPKTVANFTDLAEGKREWKHPKTGKKGTDRLYDGTIFHRVIPDFMIQGGDPAGNGMGGPGYQFEDETKGSPHKFDVKGKLAMANAGPNTNGSQFLSQWRRPLGLPGSTPSLARWSKGWISSRKSQPLPGAAGSTKERCSPAVGNHRTRVGAAAFECIASKKPAMFGGLLLPSKTKLYA